MDKLLLKKIFLSITILNLCSVCTVCSKVTSLSNEVIKVSLPQKKPVELSPIGKFNLKEINESSGLIKSRNFNNVYWTHNDSGNEAKIYPVTKNGKIIIPHKSKGQSGVDLNNVKNIDWEDIAADDKGNLIIGDVGDNLNIRDDLFIYILKEPDPFKSLTVKINHKVHVYYPEKGPESEKRNFDSEAIFWASNKLYLLTKHRDDNYTALYRLDSLDLHKKNPLKLLGIFDIRGRVTGADASINGSKLVVLTYKGVWLFENRNTGDYYFNGKISWLPILAEQCEGICIDGDNIIITNEEREIFQIGISDLILIKD